MCYLSLVEQKRNLINLITIPCSRCLWLVIEQSMPATPFGKPFLLIAGQEAPIGDLLLFLQLFSVMPAEEYECELFETLPYVLSSTSAIWLFAVVVVVWLALDEQELEMRARIDNDRRNFGIVIAAEPLAGWGIRVLSLALLFANIFRMVAGDGGVGILDDCGTDTGVVGFDNDLDMVSPGMFCEWYEAKKLLRNPWSQMVQCWLELRVFSQFLNIHLNCCGAHSLLFKYSAQPALCALSLKYTVSDSDTFGRRILISYAKECFNQVYRVVYKNRFTHSHAKIGMYNIQYLNFHLLLLISADKPI